MFFFKKIPYPFPMLSRSSLTEKLPIQIILSKIFFKIPLVLKEIAVLFISENQLLPALQLLPPKVLLLFEI
jgi:phage FluMu gp28-like protein